MNNRGKAIIRKVETVEVIKVIITKGEGTEDSPVMMAEQYWGKEGQYIGELDTNYLQDTDKSFFASK